MNRTMTSLLALGIGAAAYSMTRGNNMINGRTMRKMRKRITKAIF
ncbi:YrzQ family protein [Calidifontibacillus oryziterrae]|nr:YrzQ family protein [Calidifontibacillus oryziterrae]